MRGAIFHEIRAKFGYGSQIRKLDVTRVMEMSWSDRLFMITDRHLPYTFRVEYYDPHNKFTPIPVVTSGGFGWGWGLATQTSKIITFRYPSYEELEKDRDEITRLQNALQRLVQKDLLREEEDKTKV